MTDLLQYEFMRNAIMAAALASIICGIMGPVTVIRRSIMTAGGIAHGAYGGIGLAWYLGCPPRTGAYVAALILGIIAIFMRRKTPQRADSIMGILWAVGMATGIIFTDLTPGYGSELTSYLFGSILTVSSSDLVIMSLLAIFTISPIIFFYNEIEAFLFDETFASTRGIPVWFIDGIVTLLTALAVVAVIRVVGLILVIALFTIPSLISEKMSNSLRGMMIRATVLSLLFCISGLWVSVKFDLTAGASIILVSATGYVVIELLNRIFKNTR